VAKPDIATSPEQAGQNAEEHKGSERGGNGDKPILRHNGRQESSLVTREVGHR